MRKTEIWWPNRAEKDPFPADVDRVKNDGVKLLGAPIGTEKWTAEFVKKKLTALKEVQGLLKEVDNAQVEFGLFRGCLQFNKINHLLRACPPHILNDTLKKFDDHFHDMVAEILRVGCLSEEQWEQASLPVRYAGLGVAQTRQVAGAAFVGSCALTRDLVAAILKRESYHPDGVTELLADHAHTTGKPHEFEALTRERSVQETLSSERHEAALERLKAKSSTRTRNLLLACSMPHASDWLMCPGSLSGPQHAV